LVVLCALAVVLTIVGAINAFELLSLGFGWIIERIEAAFNWASERNPIGAAWDWALANDLPQGWAILLGVIIGLALIAWQLQIGTALNGNSLTMRSLTAFTSASVIHGHDRAAYLLRFRVASPLRPSS
jgi:hypothetical protein